MNAIELLRQEANRIGGNVVKHHGRLYYIDKVENEEELVVTFDKWLDKAEEYYLDNIESSISFFTMREYWREILNLKASIEVQSEMFDYYDFCKYLVKYCYWGLYFIPDKYKDYELCLESVINQPYSFGFVPKEILTERFCLEALDYNHTLSKYIPKKFVHSEDFRDKVSELSNELAIRSITKRLLRYNFD